MLKFLLFSCDFGLVYPCRSKKADAGVDCSSCIGFVKLLDDSVFKG